PGLQALGSTAGAGEDYHYDVRRDSYRAHNNYFDTVDELHEVRGVSDDFLGAFGSALTVYGGCKLNTAAIGDVPLMGKIALVRAIMASAIKNPADPGMAEPNATQLAVEVARELQFLGDSFAPITEPSEIADLFKDPMNSL